MQRDFAAGVYQSLKTGETVSHVGIFDPALWTVAPITIFPFQPQSIFLEMKQG
jgi:hypothetical protein